MRIICVCYTHAVNWHAAMVGTSLLFLLLVISCREAYSYNPKPNSKSVVEVGGARFTVLTERLVRMEWGGANDNATFAFLNRDLPTPTYNVSKEGNATVIQTPYVKVTYLPNGKTFTADNLQVSIHLNGQTVTWSPEPTWNMTLNGNLLGTIRTLDGVNGSIDLDCYTQYRSDLHCQLGLVSRDGYVIVDDTHHPHFDDSTWPWVVNTTYPQPNASDCTPIPPEQRIDCGFPGISVFDCMNKGCCMDTSKQVRGIPACYYGMTSYKDLYFFGHGHDYRAALHEFTMVSGKVPIPPRYAFGIYYSRYWAYNDIGEMDVVMGYETRGIPLDTLVTDMDWHITFYKEAAEGKKDQAGESIGWTGFTWDKHLFPDPKPFLDWCEAKGLQNTLNIHPASGIQPWEDTYTEMATAMGIDPKTEKYVPLVPSDLKFVVNWLTIVMAAREREGIDFWWLDWQQGEDWIKIPLVNPTFWLNHIFFTTPYHWSDNRRPFLLHRWGGLGNHRYQAGFSGDVYPSWASLHFQVNFTLKATNVAFGYWSHDLGGHLAATPPELYTRWIQWGAFSPMFRTHCTKNPGVDRRIWVYPPVNYEIMRRFFILRASLVPYIYSSARQTYDEGLSLLRPLYYLFPEAQGAYDYDMQYMFGSDLLVAPVTEPVDTVTQMVTKLIWIPEGSYISWFSGEYVTGPVTITRTFTLAEMPVYVREGSIIAMRTDDFAPLGSAQEIPSAMKYVVFVGKANSGESWLYEDDGTTTDYMSGRTANTSLKFTVDRTQSVLNVTIGPTSGGFPGLPSSRQYQIQVHTFSPADSVSVAGNSVPYVPLASSYADYTSDCWTYDGSSLSLLVNIVSRHSLTSPLEVSISFSSYSTSDPYTFQGFAGKLARLQAAKHTLDMQWGTDIVYQEDYFSLLLGAEVGERITYSPSSFPSLLSGFANYVTMAINEVNALSNLNSKVKAQVLDQIGEA